MRLRLPLVTAAVVGLAAVGTTAGAAPAPDCNGQQYKDAKGDAALQSGEAPMLDVLQGFITVTGADATYHLQVADLATSPPPPYTTLNWYLMWNAEDEERFVEAAYSPETGVSYSYGILDATTGFSKDADVAVSGTYTEGPNGFFSIVLPKEKVSVGGTLATPHADTRGGIGSNTTGGVVWEADTAAGKTVKLTDCAAAPPAPTPGPGTPTPPEQPVVQFSLVGKPGKVKKKKLALKIKSSGPVTGLTAKLVKGKKVVGTGKLAKLDGTAKLTVKLKSKKLKKGSYKLNVSSKDSSGRNAGATLPLKLR